MQCTQHLYQIIAVNNRQIFIFKQLLFDHNSPNNNLQISGLVSSSKVVKNGASGIAGCLSESIDGWSGVADCLLCKHKMNVLC